jgi:hypothetical protein
MKKKYEKPEMIVEVMSMDLLQMVCTHHSSTVSKRNATAALCLCCAGTTNYPYNSHF